MYYRHQESKENVTIFLAGSMGRHPMASKEGLEDYRIRTWPFNKKYKKQRSLTHHWPTFRSSKLDSDNVINWMREICENFRLNFQSS